MVAERLVRLRVSLPFRPPASGKWRLEAYFVWGQNATRLKLAPGAISVESTGTATAGGKSYESLKANTPDLEIHLYLDSAHKLIRLEVPSTKVAVVRE